LRPSVVGLLDAVDRATLGSVGVPIENVFVAIRVLAHALGVCHAVDDRGRPALRNPSSAVSAVVATPKRLHPTTSHASVSEIVERRRRDHGGKTAAEKAIARSLTARSKTAVSERIDEGIALERSVEVSEYRVEQDEWIRETSWAGTRAESKTTEDWVRARSAEEGVLGEGIAEERRVREGVVSSMAWLRRRRGRPDAVLIVF